jgi:hypothetical protein
MANRLKMAEVQSILLLHSQGWSRRRVARELCVDRETVSRYVQLDQQSSAAVQLDGGISKPANAPISGPGSPAPVEPSIAPIEPTGPGRRSDCEPWRELILAKRGLGLSARRIYQDLTSEHAAAISYDSVRRFMRRLGWTRPLPFRRIECAPGQEAQVDFGKGAPIVSRDGKRRRTHVFRIVLSHSRKAYSESTYRQTTEDFLGAMENAFQHFGGVPQTVIIDNLKAAVKHPDEPGGEIGAQQEAWNLSMALVWHWDCAARRCHSNCYRPLFNVADNGYLIVDDRPGAQPIDDNE